MGATILNMLIEIVLIFVCNFILHCGFRVAMLTALRESEKLVDCSSFCLCILLDTIQNRAIPPCRIMKVYDDVVHPFCCKRSCNN